MKQRDNHLFQMLSVVSSSLTQTSSPLMQTPSPLEQTLSSFRARAMTTPCHGYASFIV